MDKYLMSSPTQLSQPFDMDQAYYQTYGQFGANALSTGNGSTSLPPHSDASDSNNNHIHNMQNHIHNNNHIYNSNHSHNIQQNPNLAAFSFVDEDEELVPISTHLPENKQPRIQQAQFTDEFDFSIPNLDDSAFSLNDRQVYSNHRRADSALNHQVSQMNIHVDLSQSRQSINSYNQMANQDSSHNNVHSQSAQNLHSLQTAQIQPSRSAQNLRTNSQSNSIYSMDSIPALSSSVSNQSLGDSPMSFPRAQQQNTLAQAAAAHAVTPRRTLRKKSLSVSSMQTPYTPSKGQLSPINLATTCAKVSKTPHLKMKGHTRSRSRLSVENGSSGSSGIGLSSSTSFSNLHINNNPFYTPSTFISPKIDQISTDLDDLETPLPTPNSRQSAKGSPQYSPSSPQNLRSTANPYLDSLINQENDAFKELRKAKSYSNMVQRRSTSEEENSSSTSTPGYFSNSHKRLDLSKSFSVPVEQGRIDLLSPQFASSSSNASSQISIQSTHGNQNFSQQNSSASHLHSFTKSFPASVDLASIASPGGLLPPMATFSVQNGTQNGSPYKLEPPKMSAYADPDAPTVPTSSLVQLNSMSKIDIPIVKNNRGDKNDRLDPKKKHKCPICDSRFQRPEHVKRHMKSHSSEKPFVCDVGECGKRFNRKDNLKAHLKKIHGRIL